MHLNRFPVHLEGMAKETCSAVIDNGSGKILLQLRDDKSGIDYPGTWSTFGGHLDEGETPLESLKRELLEEIEYEVSDAEYLGVVSGYIHVFRIIDTALDASKLVVHEGQMAKFFGVDDLPHIPLHGGVRDMFYEYFRRYG